MRLKRRIKKYDVEIRSILDINSTFWGYLKMFRKNDGHLQNNLFNSLYGMDSRLALKLQKSWAARFYEHVFCEIDESLFVPLYSSDNGRPNFPVNIFIGLELIKHLKEYTDEALLDEYAFNYQISFALGLRTLGERYFAPRTLYEFRSRLYNYSLEHPDRADPMFAQFEKLTDHFIKVAGLSTSEGRMDSTQIMSNIKLGGRLSLAYDVLACGVKALPEILLNDSLKIFLKADYKTQFLYQLKATDIFSRIQSVINHCVELLRLVEGQPELKHNPAIQIVDRFLKEQATFIEEQNQWIAKGNREISSKALQSAHDGDATYRKKGGKHHVGYALNLLETCADENPVQIVTHFEIASNTTSDIEMLNASLPNAEKLGVKDLYTDGGYYSPKIVEEAEAHGITMHYTDMTGRKTSSNKLPYSSFTIEDKEKIVLCPAKQAPLRTNFNEKNGILSAHFKLEICNECAQKDTCRVKFQKKDTVLYVSQKALDTEEIRMKITNKKERKESTSKRAAIEGTNSALKRAHSAGKLKVRGIVKCGLVIGAKIIAHNFRQLARFFKGEIREKAIKKLSTFNQGIPVSTC